MMNRKKEKKQRELNVFSALTRDFHNKQVNNDSLKDKQVYRTNSIEIVAGDTENNEEKKKVIYRPSVLVAATPVKKDEGKDKVTFRQEITKTYRDPLKKEEFVVREEQNKQGDDKKKKTSLSQTITKKIYRDPIKTIMSKEEEVTAVKKHTLHMDTTVNKNVIYRDPISYRPSLIVSKENIEKTNEKSKSPLNNNINYSENNENIYRDVPKIIISDSKNSLNDKIGALSNNALEEEGEEEDKEEEEMLTKTYRIPSIMDNNSQADDETKKITALNSDDPLMYRNPVTAYRVPPQQYNQEAFGYKGQKSFSIEETKLEEKTISMQNQNISNEIHDSMDSKGKGKGKGSKKEAAIYNEVSASSSIMKKAKGSKKDYNISSFSSVSSKISDVIQIEKEETKKKNSSSSSSIIVIDNKISTNTIKKEQKVTNDVNLYSMPDATASSSTISKGKMKGSKTDDTIHLEQNSFKDDIDETSIGTIDEEQDKIQIQKKGDNQSTETESGKTLNEVDFLSMHETSKTYSYKGTGKGSKKSTNNTFNFVNPPNAYNSKKGKDSKKTYNTYNVKGKSKGKGKGKGKKSNESNTNIHMHTKEQKDKTSSFLTTIVSSSESLNNSSEFLALKIPKYNNDTSLIDNEYVPSLVSSVVSCKENDLSSSEVVEELLEVEVEFLFELRYDDTFSFSDVIKSNEDNILDGIESPLLNCETSNINIATTTGANVAATSVTTVNSKLKELIKSDAGIAALSENPVDTVLGKCEHIEAINSCFKVDGKMTTFVDPAAKEDAARKEILQLLKNGMSYGKFENPDEGILELHYIGAPPSPPLTISNDSNNQDYGMNETVATILGNSKKEVAISGTGIFFIVFSIILALILLLFALYKRKSTTSRDYYFGSSSRSKAKSSSDKQFICLEDDEDLLSFKSDMKMFDEKTAFSSLFPGDVEGNDSNQNDNYVRIAPSASTDKLFVNTSIDNNQNFYDLQQHDVHRCTSQSCDICRIYHGGNENPRVPIFIPIESSQNIKRVSRYNNQRSYEAGDTIEL